jgi:hypothetical protein
MKSSGRNVKTISQSDDQTKKAHSMGHQSNSHSSNMILQLQSTIGNQAVLDLLGKLTAPLAHNVPVKQMMKIKQVDDQIRNVEATDGEKEIYDLKDLGDLQKLIEYYQITGEIMPAILIAAVENMKIKYPAREAIEEEGEEEERERVEPIAPPMVMPTSSEIEREQLRKTISELSSSYTPGNYKELITNDLLRLRPFLVPKTGPMWDDNDPILQELSIGFGKILETIQASRPIFNLFDKVGELKIPGFSSSSKGRTLMDYLNDARVSCAQSIEGEMGEWIHIINKEIT